MPSTPSAHPQVISRTFAPFRVPRSAISAGQPDFHGGFDSRQPRPTDAAEPAASRLRHRRPTDHARVFEGQSLGNDKMQVQGGSGLADAEVGDRWLNAAGADHQITIGRETTRPSRSCLYRQVAQRRGEKLDNDTKSDVEGKIKRFVSGQSKHAGPIPPVAMKARSPLDTSGGPSGARTQRWRRC